MYFPWVNMSNSTTYGSWPTYGIVLETYTLSLQAMYRCIFIYISHLCKHVLDENLL